MRGSLLYTFIMVTVLFIQSCATVEHNVMVRNIDLSDVLGTIESNQNSVNSVRGMASVKIESMSENSSFKQATVVKSPDLFRLEILAVFGKTIGVLVSDGEKVYLNTARDSMVFEDAGIFNLSYFYPGIPREITTVVLSDMLLGRVPFGLWGDSYSLQFDSETRLLDISYRNSLGRTTSLLADPVKKRVEKARVNLYNDRTVNIEYSDFGFDGMDFFPKRTVVRSDKYLLRITYVSSLDINPDLDGFVFKP